MFGHDLNGCRLMSFSIELRFLHVWKLVIVVPIALQYLIHHSHMH